MLVNGLPIKNVNNICELQEVLKPLYDGLILQTELFTVHNEDYEMYMVSACDDSYCLTVYEPDTFEDVEELYPELNYEMYFERLQGVYNYLEELRNMM